MFINKTRFLIVFLGMVLGGANLFAPGPRFRPEQVAAINYLEEQRVAANIGGRITLINLYQRLWENKKINRKLLKANFDLLVEYQSRLLDVLVNQVRSIGQGEVPRGRSSMRVSRGHLITARPKTGAKAHAKVVVSRGAAQRVTASVAAKQAPAVRQAWGSRSSSPKVDIGSFATPRRSSRSRSSSRDALPKLSEEGQAIIDLFVSLFADKRLVIGSNIIVLTKSEAKHWYNRLLDAIKKAFIYLKNNPEDYELFILGVNGATNRLDWEVFEAIKYILARYEDFDESNWIEEVYAWKFASLFAWSGLQLAVSDLVFGSKFIDNFLRKNSIEFEQLQAIVDQNDTRRIEVFNEKLFKVFTVEGSLRNTEDDPRADSSLSGVWQQKGFALK